MPHRSAHDGAGSSSTSPRFVRPATDQWRRSFADVHGRSRRSIQHRVNRDFGLPGIVNLTFAWAARRSGIKNVVYWPALNYPGEQPDNPTLGD